MDVFTPVLQHYRVYNDDGDEAASTPVAAEDASAPVAAQFGATANVHLRVLIQNTLAAGDGAASVYQLMVSKNGGAFANVTTTSPNVKSVDSANLIANGATSDRATNGLTNTAGSFLAGRISEDGDLALQIGASQFTELLYSLQLIGTDLANGDVLTFKVQRDGGDFTHSVTPTISVSQTNPTVSSASMADADRDFATPFQDIVITFSEALDITPTPNAGDTVAGLTAQVNGGANSALTYRSGNGTASWKVRRAELIQQDDTVVLDYAMASGDILAVDDNAELRETADAAVTNNLTKRIRETLKNAAGDALNAVTVKYGIFQFDGGAPANANWMTRDQKGTAVTSAAGVLDLAYTGAVAVGGTVYLVVIQPNTTPTEAMIWSSTVA